MIEDVWKLLKKSIMISYKISSDQIRQDPSLKELLRALERGLQKFEIDFFLIGAVSRDIWISGINQIPPSRTTKDIDFAVFINDKGVYERLKDYLIQSEGFCAFPGNAFALIYKDRMQVDLLPFGSLEDEHREVTFEGTGYTSIQVDGMKEVYESALPVIDLEGQLFKLCSLPGIVLLKLIAWDDRPEVRRGDIRDVSNILHHFPNMYQEIIWDKHSDLFGDDPDLDLIAAEVMGRELRNICQNSRHLYKRISCLLEINTVSAETSAIGFIMREYFDNTVEDCLFMLKAVKRGFKKD